MTSLEGERNRCPGRQFTARATRLPRSRVAFRFQIRFFPPYPFCPCQHPQRRPRSSVPGASQSCGRLPSTSGTCTRQIRKRPKLPRSRNSSSTRSSASACPWRLLLDDVRWTYGEASGGAITSAVESRCGAVAVGRTYLLSAPFVWRCLSGSTLTPFPHSAHRTGHADFPHPALGQDFTPSPTARRAQAGTGVRARSARKGARVDKSRPYCA